MTISLNSTYLYLLILPPTNLYLSTIDNSSQTQQRCISFNCDTQTDLLVSVSSANRGSASRGRSPPAASTDWLLHQCWGTKKKLLVMFRLYAVGNATGQMQSSFCTFVKCDDNGWINSFSIYDFKCIAMQTPPVVFPWTKTWTLSLLCSFGIISTTVSMPVFTSLLFFHSPALTRTHRNIKN